MSSFVNLEDSPMFRKHIHLLEQTADELKDRCQKLQKGCKRYITDIGESYDGDLSFADSLDSFGAGQDDLFSMDIGGSVVSKFTAAFRELGSYKELVRSQVEHILSDRLFQFITVDLQNVKDCRRRFDKATIVYDQAREKFMSLKKGTRADVVSELEEDLTNSKSAFETCRFNLVNALAIVEAKKKFEFLESLSAVMDAYMRYFKQGSDLLNKIEPYVNQVMSYAQQTKEMSIIEQDKLSKRIQEFRKQTELANLKSTSNMDAASSGDGIHFVGVNSYKNIEALMQSTADGEVQIIKQGYLLKRTSNLRGDWKRRFYVLDSHGTLYYYRNKKNKQTGPMAHQPSCTSEGPGVFSRFRFSHQRTPSQDDENLGCHTVDLRTSTIKIDAEQTDLRFCFRIISPLKTITLQAENGVDRKDWIEKITGVIASLINSPFPKHLSSGEFGLVDANGMDALKLKDSTGTKGYDNPSRILRTIPGNDACAECGAPEPDWASLNLGILMCIECSGVHRNLGVHISKVRSLTLDVKVWEPTIIDLFCALGNSYSNSVWEEVLLFQDKEIDESNMDRQSFKKPRPKDSFHKKEKYIQRKYIDKCLILRETSEADLPPITVRIWDAVKSNNVQVAYRLFVSCDASPNTKYDEVNNELYHIVDAPDYVNSKSSEEKKFDPATCPKIENSGERETCMQGCSLLHLACHVGDPVMLELLLQFGADTNLQDIHGRTPLHHCIFLKNNALAKYLLRRGARTSIQDCGGLTPLGRAMELGTFTDEELLVMLARS